MSVYEGLRLAVDGASAEQRRATEVSRATALLLRAGFTEKQARALARSRDTVFLVPVGGVFR